VQVVGPFAATFPGSPKEQTCRRPIPAREASDCCGSEWKAIPQSHQCQDTPCRAMLLVFSCRSTRSLLETSPTCDLEPPGAVPGGGPTGTVGGVTLVLPPGPPSCPGKSPLPGALAEGPMEPLPMPLPKPLVLLRPYLPP
jgi:hypothetical protein